jgi:hypothetical protein
MPLFQSSEIRISSGVNGDFTQLVERVQGISINAQIPRSDTMVLGKTRALNARPVINYSPVSYSVDFVKATKEIENCLGILNPSGVAYNLGTSSALSGYGCRNLEVYLVDAAADFYKGQLNIKSGYLQSYNITTTVGDIVKGSFAGEGLDIEIINNDDPRELVNYDDVGIIKPEDVQISGIQFSGFGITGLSIQSFNIGLNFNRQSVFKLGSKYPVRPLTEARASISINGFIEGLKPVDTLGRYDCGLPETGNYYLTVLPSCSNYPATIYTIKNPYLDSWTFGAQIGSFISTELSFSVILPFSLQESLTGSNLIIS